MNIQSYSTNRYQQPNMKISSNVANRPAFTGTLQLLTKFESITFDPNKNNIFISERRGGDDRIWTAVFVKNLHEEGISQTNSLNIASKLSVAEISEKIGNAVSELKGAEAAKIIKLNL